MKVVSQSAEVSNVETQVTGNIGSASTGPICFLGVYVHSLLMGAAGL